MIPRLGAAAWVIATSALLAGCATRSEVFHTDLTRQAGAYVLGYTTDAGVRGAMEDQLVADLTSRDMIAWPSHTELPDLEALTSGDLVAAANSKQAVAVILINQVSAGANDSILSNPDRITPLHPDLQSFFRQSREEMIDDFAEGQPVFAEVNLFLLDGEATRLYWSGTTWSFHADGKGTAIRGISETIADQLRDARESFTRTPFSD